MLKKKEMKPRPSTTTTLPLINLNSFLIWDYQPNRTNNSNHSIFLLHSAEDVPVISRYRKRFPQISMLLYMCQNSDNIRAYTKSLTDYLKKNAGHQRILLIGMGLGGIICAYLKEILAAEAQLNIQQVVTIDTCFSQWLMPSLDKTMLLDEQDINFLKDMAEQIAESSFPYHFIYTQEEHGLKEPGFYVKAYVAQNKTAATQVKDVTGKECLAIMNKLIKEFIHQNDQPLIKIKCG